MNGWLPEIPKNLNKDISLKTFLELNLKIMLFSEALFLSMNEK